MPLDISKITPTSTANSLKDPREIFSALPGKQPKYGYLRDVQAEVLKQWYARRDSKDLRLKMNTGAGKTLVGLLILKSCLNEDHGPAVYVSPTPYLADQVMVEAKALGLSVDNDPRSLQVARGRSILVTHVHVLFNGQSKFGVGANQEIPIGSIVLDDAHSCLATAEQQFTMTIKSDSDQAAYTELFNLFRPDLEAQASATVLDIEAKDPTKLMLVPFWAWVDKLQDVERILHPLRDRSLRFEWPLLGGTLKCCRCVIGMGRVEISSRCLPVDVIPSFVAAKRRVFMSATFADDSVLVTDFAADPDEIEKSIAPERASDIGERMILVPQELDTQISDDDLRSLVVEKAQDHNTVVIVPSFHRANFWKPVAKQVLQAENLETGIEALRQGHVGVTVIVNRYDGIDLPGDACRLLVIDGLPDARRLIDRVEQTHVQGTSVEVGKAVQQIEQGMGRAVRANDDYCVVLLMGRSLVSQLFRHNGVNRLTAATRAQFELSEKVGDQIRNKGIGEVSGAIDYCLNRDPGWVQLAKSALVHVNYDTSSSDLSIAVARREAFNAARSNDYPAAARVIQDLVNAESDSIIKGWLMLELAEHTYPSNKVNSQQILRTAHGLNRQLIRPIEGIDYQRLSPLSGEQAETAIRFLRREFQSSNALLIEGNAVASDLVFRQHSFRRFHEALHRAAFFLGFAAQLPESDYGRGPDVFWSVGGLQYFIIECKNEAITSKVNKKDTNQLAGSVNWFGEKYDNTCTGIPLLIHPSATFEFAATPPPETRVMTKEKLPEFRAAFEAYCRSMATIFATAEPPGVAKHLSAHKLLPQMIIDEFTVPARSSSRA